MVATTLHHLPGFQKLGTVARGTETAPDDLVRCQAGHEQPVTEEFAVTTHVPVTLSGSLLQVGAYIRRMMWMLGAVGCGC
eukprot:6426260-Pyramimonas_sp.AAC.1